MGENMQATLRKYIVKEKEEKGNFPEIPDEEDGGSRFIFFPEDVQDTEDSKADGGKGKKDKKKDKKDKKKDKKDKKDKKKGGDEEAPDGWKAAPSAFVADLKVDSVKYGELVKDLGQHQLYHNPDIIREEQRKIVWEEVRVNVDSIMRKETRLKINLHSDGYYPD